MTTSPEKLARFYQLIDTARPPQRADRSAGGLLPTRALRFCEAVTTASAFGWYIFPPMSFSLIWTGEQVAWTFHGTDDWITLGRAQFPDAAKGFAPPFLAALPEPGVVQVWSGLLARTAPDWSLLLRAPANLPRAGYDLFEGIVETDRWFGPLFTNVRLTRTDTPVTFDADYPLFQAQPLHRSHYADDRLNDSAFSVAWMNYSLKIGQLTAKSLCILVKPRHGNSDMMLPKFAVGGAPTTAFRSRRQHQNE